MTPATFHIPQVTDAIFRPRLSNLLEAHGSCRVFLVTGQAAQGKSTLVASFLEHQKAQSLWFHLSMAASDHGVLFDMLINGIRQQVTDAGPIPATPHITLGTREDLLRQIDILVMRLNQISTPLTIVLDDLESLDEMGSSFDLIDQLIQQSPESIRFFLLSRTQPPISLNPFKMEKRLFILNNDDLAFTLDEAQDFFRLKQPGQAQPLGPGEVEKILKITEGWAGGLILVAESVRRSHDLTRLPDHLNTEAFSYFSEEIYHALTPEIRDFLMKTALFDELDTRMLKAFFEKIDPGMILAQLEQRNLFIQKIDTNSRWPVFKYNNLFRDFLKTDLFNTLGEEKFRALNKKAGQIYWELKAHEKAVPFFMAAQAHEEIANIIRIKGTDYVIKGRAERLANWIQSLPDSLTQNDPWLVFFSTMALRIKGGKKNILTFSRALDLFRDSNDTRGIMLCIAYLIEASVFIRQPSNVILKWIRAGEDALTAMGGQVKFTWARTLLWQHIGLGYIAGNGDIPKGISACRNAILLAKGIENKDLMLNASVILTLGFVQAGDFTRAREMLEKIQTITQEGRHPEYRALKNITNIDFALKKGDLDLACDLLATSEADIEKFGLIFLYPGFVEARAIYYACIGQFTQACQTADHLSDFSILEGNEFYLGISHRIKAMSYLRQGRYNKAETAAQMAVKELGLSKRGDIHLFLARQILGFSLFHLDQPARAREELKAVLEYFQTIGSHLCYCETAFILGLLTGEASPSSSSVKDSCRFFLTGFQKAIENQYHYFPLLDHQTLARVLVQASLIIDDSDLDSYYSRVMEAIGDPLSQAVTGFICSCLDRVGKKEKVQKAEKLGRLYRLARPKIYIQTLGSFEVKVNGTVFDKSVFGGGKPIMLLKAIVFKGSLDIPKEVLIDALWPDASASSGEKNFKVNLHRLRKALEPSPVKDFGYVYLSQKSGRVSLDPDLIYIDSNIFTELGRLGRAHEEAERLDQALDCYARAVDLYHGDYFADDPYLEWIGQHREIFRQKCVEILGHMAVLNEELGHWQAAVDAWQTIISIDPCFEQAYQNLMILYADSGRKNEAQQVFNQCAAILKEELDMGPDVKTLEIHDRILAL